MSSGSWRSFGSQAGRVVVHPPVDVVAKWDSSMSEESLIQLVASYRDMYSQYCEAVASGSSAASEVSKSGEVRRWNREQRAIRLAKPKGFGVNGLRRTSSSDLGSLSSDTGASSVELRQQDGLCYRELLVGDRSLDLWPTVGQLLHLPAEEVATNDVLSGLQVQRVSEGKLHVVRGTAGPSWLHALATTVTSAGEFPKGTLAERLRGVEVPRALRGYPLALTHRVGGFGDSWQSLVTYDLRMVRYPPARCIRLDPIPFVQDGADLRGGFVSGPLPEGCTLDWFQVEIPDCPGGEVVVPLSAAAKVWAAEDLVYQGPCNVVVSSGAKLRLKMDVALYELWLTAFAAREPGISLDLHRETVVVGSPVGIPGSALGFGPGRCYQSVIKSQYRELAFERLALSPTLKELLAAPDHWFDRAAMTSLAVIGDGQLLHVTSVAGGPLVEQVLSSAARRVKLLVEKGTLLAQLRAVEVIACDYSPACKLGIDEFTIGVWLSATAGKPMYQFNQGDLDILTRGMALLSPAAKGRARVFQAIGDSVISLAIASKCLERGASAEAYQNARSSMTSTVNLSELFVKAVPQHWFTFPAGVTPGKGKVGADMFEGLVGLIYSELGMQYATGFIDVIGVFDIAAIN
jgi:hypothetical protein